MVIFQHVQMAVANFLSAKIRTLLAMLGILVGTASVVSLVSSGHLATQQALAQVASLSTNLLGVNIYDMSSDESNPIKYKLQIADALKIQNVSPSILNLAPYTNLFIATSYEGKKISASILGVTDELKNIIDIKMQSGRFITFLDIYEYYCVIGQAIYERLKAINDVDPIGKQLLVGNYIFTIIGIANTWPENSFFDQDINKSIIIPIQTSFILNKDTQIQDVIIHLKQNADIEAAEAAITAYINADVPGKQLYFRSAKKLIASIQKQRSILTWLLGLIGSVSLFVGGIGIMNIMLVTVMERKREIGVRRALGAKQRDIQLMFLIESTILSIMGGFSGVVLGIAISFVIAMVAGWQFSIYPIAPIVGFFVSVLVGIFFGFYPAYQASRLDPILMLRSE